LSGTAAALLALRLARPGDLGAHPFSTAKRILICRPPNIFSLALSSSGQSHRRDGLGGNPFAATGKAQLLGRRRLDAHPVGIEFENLGNPLDHRNAMRANLGPLADDRDIAMRNPSPLLRDQPRGMGKKLAGRGTAPPFVSRREMLADITRADGAQNSVCQGMKTDIGIGMAKQGFVVRNLDAVDPATVTGDELMHIKADPCPNIPKSEEILSASL
jgi:hypothetical protein